MTPDEFAQIQRTIEERAMQQVAMLQRIGGYLNVIKGGIGLACFLLFLILLK